MFHVVDFPLIFLVICYAKEGGAEWGRVNSSADVLGTDTLASGPLRRRAAGSVLKQLTAGAGGP